MQERGYFNHFDGRIIALACLFVEVDTFSEPAFLKELQSIFESIYYA